MFKDKNIILLLKANIKDEFREFFKNTLKEGDNIYSSNDETLIEFFNENDAFSSALQISVMISFLDNYTIIIYNEDYGYELLMKYEKNFILTKEIFDKIDINLNDFIKNEIENNIFLDIEKINKFFTDINHNYTSQNLNDNKEIINLKKDLPLNNDFLIKKEEELKKLENSINKYRFTYPIMVSLFIFSFLNQNYYLLPSLFIIAFNEKKIAYKKLELKEIKKIFKQKKEKHLNLVNKIHKLRKENNITATLIASNALYLFIFTSNINMILILSSIMTITGIRKLFLNSEINKLKKELNDAEIYIEDINEKDFNILNKKNIKENNKLEKIKNKNIMNIYNNKEDLINLVKERDLDIKIKSRIYNNLHLLDNDLNNLKNDLLNIDNILDNNLPIEELNQEIENLNIKLSNTNNKELKDSYKILIDNININKNSLTKVTEKREMIEIKINNIKTFLEKLKLNILTDNKNIEDYTLN